MKPLSRWQTLIICVALLLIHVIIARTAVVQKNAVYDEPLHTVAGWMVKNQSDYRIDKEDPALFLLYAGLPLSKNDLNISKLTETRDRVAVHHSQQWPFVTDALYRTPGIDGEAIVQRSRAMFLLITFALGATIAWLAYALSGSYAAIIATTLYAFDPNFLGHGAIVKNDVMLSLFMLLFSILLLKVGKRVTVWNVLATGLIIGGGLCVKFSGMLFVPMLLLALGVRVVLPEPWFLFRRELKGGAKRTVTAIAIAILCGIVAYTFIWGVYRFRFLPSNTDQQINLQRLVWLAKQNRLLSKIKDLDAPPPTNDDIAAQPPGLLVDGIVFANAYHLLPQAWLGGLLYTHATTQVRATYLLGQHSITGWWYFFPIAMLVKTPTATLIAIAIGIVLVFRSKRDPALWTTLALAIAPTIYFLTAIVSNLNLGLRHILPVYPLLFVFAGIVLSQWLGRREGRRTVSLLAVLLLAESILTFPNYIAFFNYPSDTAIGRLNLLSDSSFDWGQDLKTLKRWQDKHPDVHIYLAGFGTVDADFYGLRRTDLADNRQFTHPSPLGATPGVVAISATVLQGTYLDDRTRAVYGKFRDLQPREVLGGTIYLYDWP